MNVLPKQHLQKMIIAIVLLCSSVDCFSIGRVNNTRFTSTIDSNDNSIWLSDFTTWSECLCTVLSNNLFSSAVAFNLYLNGSCQLFLTLPITYRMEKETNSTLILLKQLPARDLAPCCSNLSWLIHRLNASQQASANISSPSFLIIDDHDFLVALSYKGPFIQFNRTTLSPIRTVTIGDSATSLSYRNGLYYIRK